MSARDEILDALREAAGRRAAPKPPAHPARLPGGPEAVSSPALKADDREGLIGRFIERVQAQQGEARRAADTREALEAVRQTLRRWNARGVVLEADPLVLELGLPAALPDEGFAVQLLQGGADEEAWLAELAAAVREQRAPRTPCDAAIIGCEGALAESGSVAHRTRPDHGRSGWLLCTSQLVLLNAEQIVPDLDDLFVPGGALDREGLPRAVTLITGPSRTADIEQTLTVGVHGPGRFCAIVIG